MDREERLDAHYISTSVYVQHSLYKVGLQSWQRQEPLRTMRRPTAVERTIMNVINAKKIHQTGSLKNHKLTHSGEKLHKCVQCSKSFPYASKLRNHMIIHTGEKLYKCAQCSKSFNSGAHLKSHMFTHYRKKFQICAQCGRSFSQAGHLKSHLFTHSGEKPQCNAITHALTLVN